MTCDICKENHQDWSTERLISEYRELNKARFNRIFGHNAERCQINVAQTLIDRNVTEIPNIFGAIQIRN